MTHHELKCWPEAFANVIAGVKRHEVRVFDRPYKPGDQVTLREWIPDGTGYTGRTSAWVIGHVTYPGEWGLPHNVGVFSLLPQGRALKWLCPAWKKPCECGCAEPGCCRYKDHSIAGATEHARRHGYALAERNEICGGGENDRSAR